MKNQDLTAIEFQSKEDNVFVQNAKTIKVKEINEDEGIVDLQQCLSLNSSLNCGSVYCKKDENYFIIGIHDQKARSEEEKTGEVAMRSARLFEEIDINLICKWVEDANRSKLSKSQDPWINLHTLNLARKNIGDEGTAALAKNQT